jgi:outer membrane protein assembly factor BamB
VAATQARWEVSREMTGLECVVREPGGASGSPRFDDIDDDGMVELVRSSAVGRPWSIVDIDNSVRETWIFEPALALGCEDARHTGSYAYDVQGDGRKELLNLCLADDNSRIEARDCHTGDVGLISVIPPSPSPGSHEEIAAVVRDGRHAIDAAFLTSTSDLAPHGHVRCVDIHTGLELWHHASEQEISNIEVSPAGPGGDYQVFLWSRAGGTPGDHQDTRPRVTVIDTDGTVCWSRSAGRRGAVLSGCLLKDEAGTASLVLVAANNIQSLPVRPSYLLLLDAHTGARVDSLPYTDFVINTPLSRPRAEGHSWDVYCGTEHGFIRRYVVENQHIREDASRAIATQWVWTQEFVAGDDTYGAIVVATADNSCYIVDRDLNILFKREGAEGAPISPVTTFVDPAGDSYVVFACHGNDLCIDRLVTLSGWGTRRWYVLGYAITLGMFLVARPPVRDRLRTALGALPLRRVF